MSLFNTIQCCIPSNSLLLREITFSGFEEKNQNLEENGIIVNDEYQDIQDFSKNEKHDSSIPSIKIQIKDNSYHEASSTSFLTRLSYEIHSHNNLNHSHFNYPQNFQSSFIDFVSFNSLLKIPRHKTKNHKQELIFAVISRRLSCRV